MVTLPSYVTDFVTRLLIHLQCLCTYGGTDRLSQNGPKIYSEGGQDFGVSLAGG